jgi:manganese/zinc/iron transport system substrate-binding protein
MLNRRQLLTALTASLAVPAVPVTAAPAPLNVVATTGMIGDLIGRVGGDQVQVKTLMGPGVDPHAYRQTRSDIVALTRADQVFWHGLFLEAQMEAFMGKLAGRVPVTAVAESLPQDILLGHEDYEGRFDPHVWMVPEIWVDCVPAVTKALTTLRPDQATAFEANAQKFTGEALAMGGFARDVLARVPEHQRVLISAHDAFGYFGQAYGFEVMGIQGISTESEAGLNRISELVEVIVSRKLSSVFVETSVSERNVRALIEGAAARGQNVRIGGALFSDAMGTPGTYEGTWLGMIDHNATTIARAFGVDVPERGYLGKLGA